MGGWRNNEEVELEEGEAACYSNKYGVYGDTSIDPDTALSYIEEKLQNYLGHFQRDFEGGVSAENLGSKFGEYGSFLPMYQRSPPNCSHPKVTPPQILNHSISRSPGNLLNEGGLHNTTAPLDVPLSQTRVSRNTDLLHKSKSSSIDGSIRHDPCLVAEKISTNNKLSLDKSVKNVPEQKKLTVRIKVNSDNEAQKNAALYSGLGLTSPSSSSPEESYGTPISSQEILSESSSSILKILTSFPVSGESLLSPLHENLLNLRTRKELLDAKLARANHGKLNNSSSMVQTKEIWGEKRTKCSGEGEITEQPKYEDQMCSVDKKISVKSRQSFDNVSSNKALSIKGDAKAPESLRHPEKNMPVKKRDINIDRVKNRSLGTDFNKHETLEPSHSQDFGKREHQDFPSSSMEKFGGHEVKNLRNGPSIDHKEERRSKGKIIPASFKGDVDVNLKVSSHESKKNGLKKLSSEGKKNLKRSSQINGKLTLADKSGVSTVKDKKSGQKDVKKIRDSYKDLFDTRLDHVDNSKESAHENTSRDKNKEKLNNEVPLMMSNGVEGERVGPPPVLIEEHWVLCDRCEKWRLLPPGTLPEHLPEKWLCSMLNWLSGMNRCDISEDETTRAVQAKYHAPIPEIQNNVDQIHQNDGSLYMSSEGKKKLKSKETILTNNTSGGPIMNPQEDVLRRKSVKNMNQTPMDKSDVKHVKKLHKSVETSYSNHREENDSFKGDEKPRKKIKREKEGDLYDQGSVKKVKTEVELVKNNFTSGLPSKAAFKEKPKQIDERGSEKPKISVKIRRDSSQSSMDVKTESIKKRKLMDGQDYSEKLQINGKEDSIDSGLRSVKKIKLLGSENDKLTRMPPLISKRGGLADEDVKKAHELRVKMRCGLTLDDIESLKKDLGSDHVPTAANSSSSKVSDTRRNRVNYQDVKVSSPVESVSSSPVRKRRDPMVVGPRRRSLHGVDDHDNDFTPVLESRDNKHTSSSSRGKGVTALSNLGNTTTATMAHQSSSKPRIKKPGKVSSARSNGNEKDKVSDLPSDQSKKLLRDEPVEIANKSVSNQVEARNQKKLLQVCSKETQRVNKEGGGLKVLINAKNGVHQNGKLASEDLSGPSQTQTQTQSASSALEEAEKLRDYADTLKESGFVFECNEAYFQAALMFLHGASLLENSEINKQQHGEMNQMQIYTSTAKLCETCALEYEKRQELAAAALAYKCMEVAHMRVVSCKNSTTSRVCHDLQASLQIISQNESPSSSASDIDNLNNQIAAEKAAAVSLSSNKGNTNGGSLVAGNHIIAPRNRPNFLRLLDFTRDVHCAMDASKKAQSAFAAASSSTCKVKKEIITCVKRAIDFSYHDVEQLVRMVRHAIEAINRGGIGAGNGNAN